MALTISECADKGIQVFRDRLECEPFMPESFVWWFNNELDFDMPDFLSHRSPSDWLELAGDKMISAQLLSWFDALPREQQVKEAADDIEALLEDNGHI